jgi:hypothetical protein
LFKSSSSVVPKQLRKNQRQDILNGEFDYAKMLRSGGEKESDQRDQHLPRLLAQQNKDKKSEIIKRKTGFSTKLEKVSPPPSASVYGKSLALSQKRSVPLRVIDDITLLPGEALVSILSHSPRDESIFEHIIPHLGELPFGRQVTVAPMMEDSQREKLLARDYLMLDLRDEDYYKAYHIFDGMI